VRTEDGLATDHHELVILDDVRRRSDDVIELVPAHVT
jgi:hypothetical protein